MKKNRNHGPETNTGSSVRPGAVFVGGPSLDTETVVLETVFQEELILEGHLAPSEADVQARIVERLEAEITPDVEERMIQSLTLARVSVVNHDNVVIAEEVEESPRDPPNKRPLWTIVTLTFLIVGSIVGGVAYSRGRDRHRQNIPPNTSSQRIDFGEPSMAPSMAPSAAPFSPVPLDLLLEELSYHIAPTDKELLILKNITSPQGKALAWLQDDVITRTPGRLTSIVLERYTLAVLYFSTSGETSWDFPCMNSDDICQWNVPNLDDKGVNCGEDQETVTYLAFDRLGIEGRLPWELVLLSNLKNLGIDQNKLTGPIPSRIGELTQLRVFSASGNDLTGILPETFSPVTTRIDLDRNRFTGTLPVSWGTKMPLLTGINLSNNSVTGTIPTTFGKLSSLSQLLISYNLMTGTIPSEIRQMSSLKEFYLEFNLFTESTNGSICDLLSGFQILALYADCDELECPCCTSCRWGNSNG